MNNIVELDQALKAVCPIDGVSIGKSEDKSTWRIDFMPEATDQQKTDASAVMAAFIVAELPPPVPLETRIAALESKVTSLESK